MTLLTSGNLTSAWINNNPRSYPSLERDITIDVCIIGAGITGLTSAYLLIKQGLSVAVVEDGIIGSGETGRTTAHLSNAFDDHYFEVERLHGTKNAALIANSHTAAIAEIERIVATENLTCDFIRLDGYLFVPPGDSIEILEKELVAAHRAGLNDVKWAEKCPVESLTAVPCLQFPQQAQFHPLKYLSQLAACITQAGGKIYEHTHVVKIDELNPATVYCENGVKIKANYVITATNAPIVDHEFLFSRIEANRTYVIGAKIPKNSVATGLYWDTLDPYHYIRIQPIDDNHDLLIIGGEDHRTGIEKSYDDTFKNLETWAYTRFPQIISIEHYWSGQVLEPADYLAFIGFSQSKSQNILLATGDSGNGMTHGTIAAIVFKDLILGRENPWQAIYSPQRNSLKNFKEIASYNLAGSLGYAKYLTPGEVASTAEIKLGEGAIIRDGMTKLAVYKDQAGTLYEFSAVCPHLKAILEWNPIEKTWDCPAHGSRFSACGEVLNGPANSCLKLLKKVSAS